MDWEPRFLEWAKPPSAAEQTRCDNAISIVRNAIKHYDQLKHRNTRVFAQGSYRNRVNVRQDSDVDIGVLCDSTFHYELPNGFSAAHFDIRPASYHYPQFKNDLGGALVAYLGRAAVTRGNKAFKIKATSYHLQADVVPVFEYRQYFEHRGIRYGVSLEPDDGQRIANFPEILLGHWPDSPLHYENGVAKNSATGRRFKGAVRIVKKLRNLMTESGNPNAAPIPSYLIECLVWNVPDSTFFGATWLQIARNILANIYLYTQDNSRYENLFEVDSIKYLFHSAQPWTREQAHAFASSALVEIGFK